MRAPDHPHPPGLRILFMTVGPTQEARKNSRLRPNAAKRGSKKTAPPQKTRLCSKKQRQPVQVTILVCARTPAYAMNTFARPLRAFPMKPRRFHPICSPLLASLLLALAPGCALKLRSAQEQRPTGISDSDAPATMKDQQGRAWHVNDIYRAGPAVVVFYRGHW